jgi:hypothetical protein
VKASGRGSIGHVPTHHVPPVHHAPIDRGAMHQVRIGLEQMRHAAIDRGEMHHARIGRGTFVNDQPAPKAGRLKVIEPDETVINRDENHEKAIAPIRPLVIVKPLVIAKNRLFGHHNNASEQCIGGLPDSGSAGAFCVYLRLTRRNGREANNDFQVPPYKKRPHDH